MTTLDNFFSHSGKPNIVVVDEDKKSLDFVLSSIKAQCSGARIRGYSDYKNFLEDLNIANISKKPFLIAIIRQRDIKTKFLIETSKTMGVTVFSYEGPDKICSKIGSNFCLLRQYL